MTSKLIDLFLDYAIKKYMDWSLMFDKPKQKGIIKKISAARLSVLSEIHQKETNS